MLTLNDRNGKVDKRALEALTRDPFLADPAPPPRPAAAPAPSPDHSPAPMRQDLNQSTSTVFDAGSMSSNAPTFVGIPIEKDIAPSKLEGQTSIWAGYEQDILPEKEQSQWLRNFRHQIFYLYRRLFSVVFLINFAVFISFAAKGYTTMEIGNAVVGNLTTAVLMRQEYVIDAFFIAFTAIPRTWPMPIRRVAARVYHIGGLHSGAGVSGALWLILFCAKATQEAINGEGVSPLTVDSTLMTNKGWQVSGATLCFAYAILIFLCTILIFVYPSNRKKAHNTFEATHRFLGWAAVALVWGQVLLITNDYRGNRSFGSALMRSAPFWLTLIQTSKYCVNGDRLKS